jgi:hypothetical protein
MLLLLMLLVEVCWSLLWCHVVLAICPVEGRTMLAGPIPSLLKI